MKLNEARHGYVEYDYNEVLLYSSSYADALLLKSNMQNARSHFLSDITEHFGDINETAMPPVRHRLMQMLLVVHKGLNIQRV